MVCWLALGCPSSIKPATTDFPKGPSQHNCSKQAGFAVVDSARYRLEVRVKDCSRLLPSDKSAVSRRPHCLFCIETQTSRQKERETEREELLELPQMGSLKTCVVRALLAAYCWSVLLQDIVSPTTADSISAACDLFRWLCRQHCQPWLFLACY